ncbi:MAG: HEAT repeat domain-containing protein [Planctomycetota bacterium]
MIRKSLCLVLGVATLVVGWIYLLTPRYRELPEFYQLLQADSFYVPSYDSKLDCSKVTPVAEVLAFRSLLEHKDAAAAFSELLEEATIEGQLFALCGLYFSDHVAFRDAASVYRRRSDSFIERGWGCGMSGSVIVGERVDYPYDPVRLDFQGQTLGEWGVARGVRVNPTRFDILGGAIPTLLKGIHEERAEKSIDGVDLNARLLELASEDPKVYMAADQFVRECGARAVPGLRKLLEHPEASVRLGAVEALRWMGPQAHDAALDFGRLLRDKTMRAWCAAALKDLKAWALPALQDIDRALHEEWDEGTAKLAEDLVESLGFIGPKAVPTLRKLLSHSERSVRIRVLRVLPRIGEPSRALIPRVIEFVGEGRNGEERAEAVWDLGILCTSFSPKEARPVVTSVKAALSAGDRRVRAQAMFALYRLGPSAKEAVPDLLNLLEKGERVFRLLAAQALVAIEGHPAGLDILLDHFLESRRRSISFTEELSTEELATEELSTEPSFEETLENIAPRYEDRPQGIGDARSSVLTIYRKNNELVKHLTSRIGRSTDFGDKEALIALFEELGPVARPYASFLRTLLSDEDRSVRELAALALWRVNHELDPILDPRLNESDEGESSEDSGWLGFVDLDGGGAEAVRVLTKALSEYEDPKTLKCILNALSDRGADAAPSVRAAARLLESPHESVRESAVQLLSEIGPKAVQALPTLRRIAAKGESESVREDAKRAVETLESR